MSGGESLFPRKFSPLMKRAFGKPSGNSCNESKTLC